MVTTVAPANLHSLRNCLALGFRVVVTRPMFAAGHMRHLLHLDLAPQIPAETTPVDAGVLIAVGHLPDPAIRFNPVLAAVAPAPPGDGG